MFIILFHNTTMSTEQYLVSFPYLPYANIKRIRIDLDAFPNNEHMLTSICEFIAWKYFQFISHQKETENSLLQYFN